MRAVALPILACAALAGGAAAQTFEVTRVPQRAARGYDDVRISKAAIAGEQIRVWWATMLNADCSPAGTLTTQVVDPPRHGELSISDDPFYPNFVEPNPRVVCDARKAPGKQAFYTAQPDFHGHDRMVLQNATSEGRIRKIIVDVDVR